MPSKRNISDNNASGGTDLIDKEKSKKKVKPPSKYQVVLYNDDYTPMELVAGLLIKIFRHSDLGAWKITLDVHEKGKGIAGGPYSKEIAETKANQAVDIARYSGYPLLAKHEKV